AVRNLLVANSRFPNPEIIRALLPWLENPKWAEPNGDSWVYGGANVGDESPRLMIVNALGSVRMPESVPGLIATLYEKVPRKVPDYSAYSTNSNVAANVVRAATNNNMRIVANMASRSSGGATAVEDPEEKLPMKEETVYPFRGSAIRALAMQRDVRAVPALRR